jgi:hypothetical protein
LQGHHMIRMMNNTRLFLHERRPRIIWIVLFLCCREATAGGSSCQSVAGRN